MVKVTSSQIKSMGFVEGDDILYVRFKSNDLYLYRNVPEKIFDLFMCAELSNDENKHNEVSLGSMFHYLIRIHPALYPFEKIESV